MEPSYISRISMPSRLGEYAAHKKVYELVSDRPLYRRTREATLVVSADKPKSQVETKQYSPLIQVGELLHFVLRAEVTRSKFVEGKRGKRYDPVLEQHNLDPSKPYADIVSEVGSLWLNQKSENHGFKVEELIQSDYSPISFVRPTDRRQIRLAVIDYEGLIKVTDSAVFLSTLKNGIGRAKGFGCGLMLVRRVS
jgi:CRISPR system Cascade subunit CasE